MEARRLQRLASALGTNAVVQSSVVNAATDPTLVGVGLESGSTTLASTERGIATTALRQSARTGMSV